MGKQDPRASRGLQLHIVGPRRGLQYLVRRYCALLELATTATYVPSTYRIDWFQYVLYRAFRILAWILHSTYVQYVRNRSRVLYWTGERENGGEIKKKKNPPKFLRTPFNRGLNNRRDYRIDKLWYIGTVL